MRSQTRDRSPQGPGPPDFDLATCFDSANYFGLGLRIGLALCIGLALRFGLALGFGFAMRSDSVAPPGCISGRPRLQARGRISRKSYSYFFPYPPVYSFHGYLYLYSRSVMTASSPRRASSGSRVNGILLYRFGNIIYPCSDEFKLCLSCSPVFRITGRYVFHFRLFTDSFRSFLSFLQCGFFILP